MMMRVHKSARPLVSFVLPTCVFAWGNKGLKESDFFRFSLEKNNEALNYYYDLFDELNLEYRKSHTNFVFFKTGIHIDKFGETMKQKGILVGRAFPPYYEWCRISTGRIEDVKFFGEKLREYFA